MAPNSPRVSLHRRDALRFTRPPVVLTCDTGRWVGVIAMPNNAPMAPPVNTPRQNVLRIAVHSLHRLLDHQAEPVQWCHEPRYRHLPNGKPSIRCDWVQTPRSNPNSRIDENPRDLPPGSDRLDTNKTSQTAPCLSHVPQVYPWSGGAIQTR